MASITISGVKASFGGVVALDDVHLDVADGELRVLAGPPGAGKSTLLRVVAGLKRHEAGEVVIGGRTVGQAPAGERGVAVVFGSGGLHPGQSVGANIALPLRLRQAPSGLVAERIAKLADEMGLADLLDRAPGELTPLQTLRACLARAMMSAPYAILYDDPLSHLDPSARLAMRAELREFHQRSGRTGILATDDPAEALALADRIAVLRRGRVEQQGRGLDLYDLPRNVFVARSLGLPEINLIPGRIARGDLGRPGFVSEAGLVLPLPPSAVSLIGRPVLYGVRPQHLFAGPGGVDAQVVVNQPLGAETEATVLMAGVRVRAVFRGRVAAAPGDCIRITPHLPAIHLFDPESGDRLGPD